ncbi:hypothetical protein HYU19_01495 [Candidatus Woesearchaeota archaeon]|nr:hypothetical protein [Candidatus Woesearchaeota archaeon]
MAAKKETRKKSTSGASESSDPIRARIGEFRALGIAERVYIGKSDFDGISLQVSRSLTGSLDELVAPCNPTDANLGYGGVFERTQRVSSTQSSGSSYTAVNTRPLVQVIKTYLGQEAGNYIIPAVAAKPNNISVHLIRQPESGQLHAFFMPSDAYVGSVEEDMKAAAEQ